MFCNSILYYLSSSIPFLLHTIIDNHKSLCLVKMSFPSKSIQLLHFFGSFLHVEFLSMIGFVKTSNSIPLTYEADSSQLILLI